MPARKRLPAAPAKTPALQPASANALVVELERRLGETLPADIRERLTPVEAWLAHRRRTIARYELEDLGTLPPGWNYEDIELWPAEAPPRSLWEGWLRVAHALKRNGGTFAFPLEQTVNWAEADAIAAPWVRARAVTRWRELLALTTRMETTADAPQFRLRLDDEGGTLEWREPGKPTFVPAKAKATLIWAAGGTRSAALDSRSAQLLRACRCDGYTMPPLAWSAETLARALQVLLRTPDMLAAVVGPDGEPLRMETEPLHWTLRPVKTPSGTDYQLTLADAAGNTPPPAKRILSGRPALHVTARAVWPLSAEPPSALNLEHDAIIPAEALESTAGLGFLDRMRIEPPASLAARIITAPASVVARCRMTRSPWNQCEYLGVTLHATFDGRADPEVYRDEGWTPVPAPGGKGRPATGGGLVRLDRSLLDPAAAWLHTSDLRPAPNAVATATHHWEKRIVNRSFPEEFLAWINARPACLELDLDPELNTLRHGTVAGTVSLDVTESGMDWFDLRVNLKVADVELSPEEIALLLKAPGRWVRLKDRGWHRLEVQLTDEQQAHLADLGLSVGEFSDEPQRLHVLQLAGAKNSNLLPAERAAYVARRAAELKTRVTPEVPASVNATLRPYQVSGFHFLAYLSTNGFGGVLADDMGLGKTLQALTWLTWLREKSGPRPNPVLIVCPKSVLENWRSEAARFCPHLKVHVWRPESAGDLDDMPSDTDLLVINYTQLRLHESGLVARAWQTVILDEAQAIKNPSSQTAKAACALRADHRLALSGTPIENRLLDLWSLFAFAMPGILGTRAAFAKHFDQKGDPFSRRRLAARVRPFLLRRTKKEVAPDLPERIEEDLLCTLEGDQAVLYRAELKRARAQLLGVTTRKQLDAARFNLLTSLLRLRQICCHPGLVGKEDSESTKLNALLDVLEPLMEEGHKVLVFSQFVEMLELIRAEVKRREWPHFMLTGQTEDRGPLVESFQTAEGAGVFLISLKAGGFGLNLTAASYVVLFDPWWNPAVEAQAIDRTHRIGQRNTVIAYRLIVKDTLEEKIRRLQKTKGALAHDVLGEENFAKALTLDDFKFLLEGPTLE